MSTPDASLSPQERAALASLEAAAAAADPQLAVRLRGPGQSQARTFLPRLVAYLIGRWRTLQRLRWWGLAGVAAGLVLMVLGLSINLLISLVGALITTGGLTLVGEVVAERWRGLGRRIPPSDEL